MKLLGNSLFRKCLAVLFAAMMVFSILPMSVVAEAVKSLGQDDGIGQVREFNGTSGGTSTDAALSTRAENVYYEKATSIEAGEEYLITYTYSGTVYVATTTYYNTNNTYQPNAVAAIVTANGNGYNITMNNGTDVNSYLFTAGGSNGAWTFKNTVGWLAMTGSNGYPYYATSAAYWTVSGDSTSGFKFTVNNNYTYKYLVHNDSTTAHYLDNTYSSASASAFTLYKKVVETVSSDNMARIILTAGDVWGDGTGYQMLLDADANTFGRIIHETNALTQSSDASSEVYNEFEYKIPVNADGALTTTNIVMNGSVEILVPPGTYDWCITNPTPNDRMYIASNLGNIPGRYDDYVFEANKTYEFTVTLSGQNDRVDLVITDNGTPDPTPTPTTAPSSYHYELTTTIEPGQTYLIVYGNSTTAANSTTMVAMTNSFVSTSSSTTYDELNSADVVFQTGSNKSIITGVGNGIVNNNATYSVADCEWEFIGVSSDGTGIADTYILLNDSKNVILDVYDFQSGYFKLITPEYVGNSIDNAVATMAWKFTLTNSAYFRTSNYSSNNTNYGLYYAQSYGFYPSTTKSNIYLYKKVADVVTTPTPTPTTPILTLDKTMIGLSMQGTSVDTITATVENLPAGANPTFTWTSDDTGVATVSESGNPATVTAVANGQTTVTCTVTYDDNGVTNTLTATAIVRVQELMLVSISLNPQSVTLEMDRPTVTAEITATVTTNPAGGVVDTDYELLWTSSSPNFATVTPIAGTNRATVTPVAAGSTTITCVAINKYNPSQTVRYTCMVIVKAEGQIPAPDTGAGGGETPVYETVYVLVNDFSTDGGNYIIAQGNSGSPYALRDTGATYVQRGSVTVLTGTGYGNYGKYIRTTDNSLVWRFQYSSTNSTYGIMGGLFNVGTGRGFSQSTSSPYVIQSNANSTAYIYSYPNSGSSQYHYIMNANNYYLYYYSTTYPYCFYDTGTGYRTQFWYYKETVVQTGNTTVDSGVDIYCDGTKISQQEYGVQAGAGTQITLEGTPLNVPASATNKSTSWSIYNQSSPAIASVNASTGVVTFTGETGFAVVKVTYTYRYGGTNYTVTNYTKLMVVTPEPETDTDTVATTQTIFQLVNNFQDGGNYIIVYNKNTASTTAQALTPIGNQVTYTMDYDGDGTNEYYYGYWVGNSGYITINDASTMSGATDSYIITDDASIMWRSEALSSGAYRLTNASTGDKMSYLAPTSSSGNYLFAESQFSVGIRYNSTNKRLYYSGTSTTNYFGNSNNYSSSYGYPYTTNTTSAGTFYLYKEVEVETTTTGTVGVDIYNGNTNVSGTTVDVSGTSIQLTQRNNLPSSVTNETVTWEIIGSDIATIDQNGLVTVVGDASGDVLVKVTLSWVSGGVTKTATNYVTLRISSGDVYVDTSDTENFPEYPNGGSIRLEKNAYTAEGTDYYNTGVGTVELFARGVPMNSKPIDVVVVMDVSGSMTDDINGGTTGTPKITLAKNTAKRFAEELLSGSNGYTDNRLAIVTFSSDANVITGTNRLVPSYTALVGAGSQAELNSINTIIDGITANGGTNYDAALEYAYKILNSARSQPNYSREQYVIFLTDGAPGWYNQMELDSAVFPAASTYYTQSEVDEISSLWYKWTTGTKLTRSDWSSMPTAAVNGFNQYAFPDHHYAAAIKARSFSALGMSSALRTELGITSALGATIYGVSLGMSAGSQITGLSTSSSARSWTQFTSAQCTELITRMVGSPDRVFAANDTTQLDAAFESIGNAILLAGTNAVVTDVIAPNYELQTANYGNITEYPSFSAGSDSKSATITVRRYDVDANGNRTGAFEVLEKVTFNTDGTAAYSNVLGSGNILSTNPNGTYVILASLFTYDSATKTFTWHIGDITESDIALRYNVYLTDTRNIAENTAGPRSGGRYDTNAEAYIIYENHQGNRCKKVYNVPSLPWASALVNYRFYLVNEAGQPVNSSGVVVGYNNLTYLTDTRKVDMTRTSAGVGSFNYEYTLNAAALKAGIAALTGYELYDDAAAYAVTSNGRGGSEGRGSYTVTKGGVSANTTVIRNAPNAAPFARPTGTTSVDGDYTNTTVEFAVVWAVKVIPDAIVIDYGLPVNIPVVGNDMVSSLNAVLHGIYPSSVTPPANGEQTPYSNSISSANLGGSLMLNYGTASIIDAQNIHYTPTSMSMGGVENFGYEVAFNGAGGTRYLTSSVKVIPATTIYYEDNFTGNGITYTSGVGGAAAWTVVGTATATVQDTDYVGVGGNYGHDSHYENGMTYSLSSAHKITVTQEHFDAMAADSSLKWPTASFTFTGTGFDLVSLCNADAGILTVRVTDANTGEVKLSTFVNNFYEGTQVIVGGTMYQIPVINLYDLDYGTYNVVITTPYVPILDSTNATGDGSYDLYIDGVRIYDPAEGNATAEAAYIEDNEAFPIFKEMRDMLLNSVAFDPDAEGSELIEFGGALFVDGNAATPLASIYADEGPNNEIYLAPGQGITLMLKATGAQPTGIYIGMKSPNGVAIGAMAANQAGSVIRNTVNVNTTSDMFYEITPDILGTWVNVGNTWMSQPIVLSNTSAENSGRVIALTNLKAAFATPSDNYDIEFVSTVPAASNAHEMIRNRMIELYGHNYDMTIHSAVVADATITLGRPVQITAVTSTDVDEMVITEGKKVVVQPDSIGYVDGENGERCWSITVTPVTTGFKIYDMMGVGPFGMTTAMVKSVSVIVSARPPLAWQNPIATPFPTTGRM